LLKGHFLNAAASAEDSHWIFDQLLQHIHTQHRPVVRSHRQDEERHVAMFHKRIHELGVTPYPVKTEYNLFAQLAKAVGLEDLDFVSDPVMKAYVLLYVGEARAVWQYGHIISLLKGTDDEITAVMLQEIVADEKRHVKTCKNMAKMYASSYDEYEACLREYEVVESKVFAKFGRAILGGLAWPT